MISGFWLFKLQDTGWKTPLIPLVVQTWNCISVIKVLQQNLRPQAPCWVSPVLQQVQPPPPVTSPPAATEPIRSSPAASRSCCCCCCCRPDVEGHLRRHTERWVRSLFNGVMGNLEATGGYCTFLAGRSDPAVQAAAAAAARLALRPVLAFAGVAAVGPVAVHAAVWQVKEKRKKNQFWNFNAPIFESFCYFMPNGDWNVQMLN